MLESLSCLLNPKRSRPMKHGAVEDETWEVECTKIPYLADKKTVRSKINVDDSLT